MSAFSMQTLGCTKHNMPFGIDKDGMSFRIRDPGSPQGCKHRVKHGKKQASILTYHLRFFQIAASGVFPEFLPVTFAQGTGEIQQRPCVGFAPNFHDLFPVFNSRTL